MKEEGGVMFTNVFAPIMILRNYRIVAPHFVAGLSTEDNRVYLTPPIINYMHSWSFDKVQDYVKKKGWTVEELTT